MSSDCCSVSETTQKEMVLCPRCDEKGRPVSLATVGAMAKTEVEAAKLSANEYKLCLSRDCPVVYYAEEIQLEKRDLRVPVNFKERNYGGPVCYCFNHTVASIRAEVETKVIPQHREGSPKKSRPVDVPARSRTLQAHAV